jgi:hypothetical protein
MANCESPGRAKDFDGKNFRPFGAPANTNSYQGFATLTPGYYLSAASRLNFDFFSGPSFPLLAQQNFAHFAFKIVDHPTVAVERQRLAPQMGRLRAMTPTYLTKASPSRVRRQAKY